MGGRAGGCGLDFVPDSGRDVVDLELGCRDLRAERAATGEGQQVVRHVAQHPAMKKAVLLPQRLLSRNAHRHAFGIEACQFGAEQAAERLAVQRLLGGSQVSRHDRFLQRRDSEWGGWHRGRAGYRRRHTGATHRRHRICGLTVVGSASHQRAHGHLGQFGRDR